MQRLLGLLQGKNCPMADRHVPRNYPRNNCRTYFGSSRLLVSNVANRGGEISLRFGIEHTAVKRLNRYFCFLLLGFHLPVREKWAKMYKSVSQHNYRFHFCQNFELFWLKTLRAKRESCLKIAPIITSASVFNHLELFS